MPTKKQTTTPQPLNRAKRDRADRKWLRDNGYTEQQVEAYIAIPDGLTQNEEVEGQLI